MNPGRGDPGDSLIWTKLSSMRWISVWITEITNTSNWDGKLRGVSYGSIVSYIHTWLLAPYSEIDQKHIYFTSAPGSSIDDTMMEPTVPRCSPEISLDAGGVKGPIMIRSIPKDRYWRCGEQAVRMIILHTSIDLSVFELAKQRIQWYRAWKPAVL